MNSSCNVKRVIELLHNSRREQRVNIEQLCDGICTRSMYEKVESGARTLNRNYLNRLLARLGIDQKKYEKYLYHADYENWKERNNIINAIEDGELQKADELLDLYECKCRDGDRLEQQFCKFMKAQILQHKGTVDEEEVYNLYQQALLLTVPNAYERETCKLMLSTDEFNLMLECRRREMLYSDVYEIFDIYQGLIMYIDNSNYDACSKAKIYPKVVVYMYNHVSECSEEMDDMRKNLMYIRMQKYCKKAIELLKNSNRAYYLCELLETDIKLMKYVQRLKLHKDKIERYKVDVAMKAEILKAYKKLCHEYAIPPYIKDCCYLYREEEVYCIHDVIYKRRKMLGMTMTKLCENICSQRTLRRFERKERNSVEDTIDEIFYRLGMSGEYSNMRITAGSTGVLETYEGCRRAINARDMEGSKQLYSRLKNELEDNNINRQILLQLKSLILWNCEEISDAQHISNMINSIRYTINFPQTYKKAVPKFFTYPEILGIHDLGVAMYRRGNCEEGMKKISLLVEYFESLEKEGLADAFISMYEMVMGSQANMAGSIGRYEYSTVMFRRLNRLNLKLRRTNLLHYNEYNIAWNDNEKHKNTDKYKTTVKNCICLCRLTQNDFYEKFYLKKLNEISH